MRATAGITGLWLGVLVWLVCSLLSMNSGAPTLPQSGGTLMLPPEQWGLPFTLSCLLNMLLGIIIAMGLWLLNKVYNLLPGMLFSSLFLCFAGTFPGINSTLSPALITSAVALTATYMLFGIYGRRNSASTSLLIFSLLSWGSMVQTACLMLVPVFIVGLVFLQAGRFKQIAAALLGVLTPYWILLGSGLASMEQLQFAIPENITAMSGSPQLLFGLCLSAGVAAFSAVMLMLYNALHTLSAGVKVRAYYSFINLLGCACILLMLIDTANFIAYAGVLLVSLSLVVTRTVILSRSPRSWILPACLITIFLLLFILHD